MGYWGVLNARLSHGKFKTVNAVDTINAGGFFTDIHVITGAGILYTARFSTEPQVNSHIVIPRIRIDEVTLHPYETYLNWNLQHETGKASSPAELTAYNVDGYNSMTYNFPYGLRFDASLKFAGAVNGVNDVDLAVTSIYEEGT